MSAEPGTDRHGRRAGALMRQAIKGDPESRPYRRRFETLRAIRSPMERVWREVRDFLLPACGRHLDGDDGTRPEEEFRVNQSCILDSSPIKMIITAADGLHGGLTNQGEQWFSLYVGNYRDYREHVSEESRAWIVNAQECERDTLAISNFYSAAYHLYLESLGFGTAVMLVMSDAKSRVRYYPQTIGSYWLSQDSRRRIDSLYVRSAVRAVELVERYGGRNCPDRVVDAVRGKRPERKFSVIQCIQPWNHFGRNGRHPRFAYEDVRYVEGGGDDERILARTGYLTKPFVAVRWMDMGDAVYGQSCPGIDALPDIKQLQVMTRDYNMAVKWGSNPAWAHNANTDIPGDSIIPGGIYKVDGNVRDNLLVPLVPPAFDIPANMQAAAALRERIGAALYNREILMVQSRERQILP